jgi:hypothetical protein
MKNLMQLKIISFILTLAAGFILSFTASHAQSVQRNLIEQKDVIILFDTGLQSVAEKVASFYPAIKSELEKSIGWKVNSRPEIVLIKDNETFQKMSGNPLIVGYALPDKGVIVIDHSKMMEPFSLETIVKHELCHLLLHEYIKDDNLPRWLDEGVAQWASGGLADIVMEKRSVLDGAVLQNRMLGLRYLSDGFPGDDVRLRLAYAESKSFVEYMATLKGAQSLPALLDSLKDGNDIDSAIMETFSISFAELEQNWHDSLEKKGLWISFLINNLTEILFFLSALILIYGFMRAWRRKKRRYEEAEEERGGTEEDR